MIKIFKTNLIDLVVILHGGKVLSKLDDCLESFEQIIWRGKPNKKAFKLEAFTLQDWETLGHNRNEEYMLTNQRLLIKDGNKKDDIWFTRLEKIKKVIVKKSITGSILDTGTIYPITEEYPYIPKTENSSKSENNSESVKVYNHFREEYEEFTKLEFSTKNRNRPKLLEIKEPYKVQKIFEEAIFGAGTNYINCEYCSFRYDLNKQQRCPNCGAKQSKKSKLDKCLDPFEQVIWKGKPNKKGFILQACGSLPFALVFFLGFLPLFLSSGFLGPQIFILGFVIVLALQPLGAFRVYPNQEYMITNQRLLIKDGYKKDDIWFTRLEKIKKVIVKKHFTSKILGYTGTIYPITEECPYVTGGIQSYNSGVAKIYNHIRDDFEELTQRELQTAARSRPKLDVMKEPYKIQKILEEAIFGAGINYVNCQYCDCRYDLNKEGKCPHCGGTHQKNN